MAVKALRGDALAKKLSYQNPSVKKAAVNVGAFAVGLAMGAGELFSSCGPFVIAIAAAAGCETRGVLCVFGAVIGYFISGGLDVSVRYIATMFLVFTTEFVLRGLKLARTDWFKPLVAVTFMAGTGFLYSMRTIAEVPALLRLLTEVTLAGGCTYFFSIALQGGGTATESAETRKGISLVIFCACALMGFGNIVLWDVISIGRFLSVAMVMILSFGGGPLTGCAAGAAFGLAMDMAEGTSLFCAAAYAFSALVAGALYRRGRLAFTIAYCAANAMAVLVAWSDGIHLPALYECFAASVIFMLLPNSIILPVGALLRATDGRGEATFRLYQAARLEKVGDAFEDMYETVRASAGSESGDGDASSVFDRASDAVCRSCDNKELCWQKEYMSTVSAMNEVAEKMFRNGALSVSDLPEQFRNRCKDAQIFVSAINGELRGQMYRRQYRARLRESRVAAYGQFGDVSDIVHAAARELSGNAGPDTAAERRLGRYMKSRDIGGTCSVFRDVRGRLRAVIESPDIQRVMDEEDYLEKLSQVLGERLCSQSGQDVCRMMLVQAEPLAVSVGIAAMKKEGEQISGDRGTYFKTDAGVLCVLLSDGMGTGPKAAAESASAVQILESFLRAGVEPASAMRLLNSVTLLKNGEDWGYATVDLCCIDLFTGDTCFFKYGAAPSYIKTGRSIRRVRCNSVAAGMLAGDGSGPDVVRMRMRPGNIALIASDGVMAEKKDQWLRDILDKADNMEAKEIARSALKAASERFGGVDDMTALVIRVEERP
jgi:stage II sporulation protein E